ncbi:zinc-binding dehydrogenase [Hyphomonas jannaschiana]|uniref:Zinc-binding dehydrogenase family oxidoreductase n=1 Tax=Hyphomonas jannaschiana VP2 TaxID=1280952 RepID=A0A059FEZ0_9PROT|nr:zinc-binding dehydrogenase [Hyphomonas jannaschiana]KCZ89048.1 zinc-binding dehydrogenase family oxidoreductase [Hyphomonas jannaschiana VP2]
MADQLPETSLQIRTLVTPEGKLELSLENAPVKAPGPDQVLVRVEGTPINPSDLGLLVGGADMSTAVQGGTKDSPTVSADVPEGGLRAMKARLGQSLAVGNEGAGTVIAAGDSPAAQALLGKMVTCLGGNMYQQYRTLHVSQCMALPDGTTAEQGASCYVNPLTALSFVETMKAKGHEALVHTAAASNLGQMLNKICLKDGVPILNIVRKEEQAEILRGIGAKHIVNSTSPTFMEDLINGLVETGATMGFDAIGGGPLAGQLLIAMEAAASRKMKEYSRYGSGQETQVYIYGRLDMSPTIVPAGVGFAWNLSGYLLTPFLEKASPEVCARMYKRVIDELNTTFASHYTKTISLAEALDLETLHAYNAKATGEKYLIDPTL